VACAAQHEIISAAGKDVVVSATGIDDIVIKPRGDQIVEIRTEDVLDHILAINIGIFDEQAVHWVMRVGQVIFGVFIIDLRKGPWIDRCLEKVRLLRRDLIHVDPRAFQGVKDVATGDRGNVQPRLRDGARIVMLSVEAHDPDMVRQTSKVENLPVDAQLIAPVIEILDPADNEPRHVIDVREVKAVFTGPAADMMTMREPRNVAEIKIGQVMTGSGIGVDLSEVILRGRRDRIVAAEGEEPAMRHQQDIVARGSSYGFMRVHLMDLPDVNDHSLFG
jgi:hypothetical protein